LERKCLMRASKLKHWGIFLALAVTLALPVVAPAQGKKGRVLFYASFDKGVNADGAAGSRVGIFNGHPAKLDWAKAAQSQRDSLLKLVPGIRGNGLLTGVNGQVVYYRAERNINPRSWTISFWVKGLEGKNYLDPKASHQELVEIRGDGWTRFYKYDKMGGLWLLVQKKGPSNENIVQKLVLDTRFDVSKWHFFALTCEKGKGVHVYIDGKLVAQDAGIEPIEKPAWFRVGQSFGGEGTPNRIIDEFKIYARALNEDEIAQKFLNEGNLSTEQEAHVRKTDAKILIDGKISAREWKDATVISGFIDNGKVTAAETQTRLYMTYDDKNLYCAFQSDIPEEAKDMPEQRLLKGILKNTKINHDVNVEADDAFRIIVIPRYPKGSMYLLTVNGIETQYEYSISPEGQIKLKWDPKWKTRSHISMEGWTVEISIPLEDLDIDAIRDGEVWGFQFFRYWRLLKKEIDTWAYFSGPKKARERVGKIVFAGKKAVAVKTEEFSGLKQGKVNLKAAIHNASPEKKVVTATLKAGDEVLETRKLALAPNSQAEFEGKGDLTQIKANMLAFDVIGSDGTVYFSQKIPYFIPQALAISLKKYPSAEILAVFWQLRKIDKRAEELGASIEIIPAAGGNAVFSKKVQPLNSLDGSANISTKEIPSGKYKVKMTIRDRDKVIVEKLVDYEKKPLPEWYGNSLGISDKVIAPWTALQVKDDAVEMWGRTYDFGGGLFPKDIVNQGKRILSGPIELAARTAGAPLAKSSSASCKVRWDEKKPIKVASTRTQELAGLEVTNKSYIEFDGMMWIDLTVAPQAGKAAIEELTLSIPMKKEFAHLINAYDYSLRTTGELPEKGYASAMGPKWVGDEEGGIQVFAETSETWIVKDKRKELEITNSEKEVAFKLHLIDKQAVLTKPVTFSFGLIVTPVKKTVPDMRDILSISGRWNPVIKGTGVVGEYYKKAHKVHKGLKAYFIWSQGWWKTEPGYKGNPDHTGFYPVPRESLDKSWGAYKTDYGMMVYSGPYGRLQQTWAASPEFEQFGDEWMSNINETFIPNPSIPKAQWAIQSCQNAQSFQDFTLYGYNKLFEGTSAQGLYFDVSKPHACNNVYHGCGMALEGARPLNTVNYLGTRRLIRRIYTLLRQKHPDGRIFFHMSGQVIMPCWSFTDAMVDGENYTSLLDRKNNRGYENVLRLDQFAAEYAGQNNFGPYGVFLPEFGRSGAIRPDEWKKLGYQHAEYVLGLIFLHNSQLWFPAYIPTEPCVNLYYAFDKNGLDSSWRYVGYWKQEAVKLPEDVKASFFVSPDKKQAFMIVMNFAGRNKKLDLKLAPEKIGMAGRLRNAAMLYPAGNLQLAGNTLKSVTIPAKNFRLFLLQ